MRTYRGKITKLEDSQIFIFGSNTEGRHGKGSAKFAKDKCGAIYGKPYGPQGRSYAIITKDLTKKYHPSISEDVIINQILNLYRYAEQHPDLEFLVPYSSSTINLNSYSSQDMANMFSCGVIPENIVFEEGFSKLLKFQSC